MAGRLAGKAAIVTGAGSVGPGWGNGKATAVLFAREGAQVFGVDRNMAALDETAAIVASEGGRFAAHAADVTKETEVKALVARCLETYGHVDVLHNNVGITDQQGQRHRPQRLRPRLFEHGIHQQRLIRAMTASSGRP